MRARVGPWLLTLTVWIGYPALADAQQVTVSGVLHVVWGDPPNGPPILRYSVSDDRGRTIDVRFADGLVERNGGDAGVNGRRVTVSGYWRAPDGAPPGAATALRATTLSVLPGSRAMGPAQVGNKRYIAVLCRFSDSPTVTPRPVAAFEALLSTAAPGVGFYWSEVSAGAISLANTQVAGWYDLPRPLSSYYDGTGDPDRQALLNDCATAADPDVDFPSYYGIILQFNRDFGCCAWGGFATRTYDGQARTYGVMWMPAWAQASQVVRAVYAHEMGHSLGLPHSSGPYGNVYDSRWDVMSDVRTNFSLETQGWLGDHTIAYHKDLLGWIPPGRKVIVESVGQRSFVLERSALPPDNVNPLVAQVPVPDGSGRFYTIEARRFVGYDVGVPGEAVVIHEVDPGRSEPAHVVDPDNNGDPNDAGARWLPGETFTAGRVSIQVTSATATGYGVTVAVAPSPSIVLTPPSLIFRGAQGRNRPESQTVSVTNGGGGVLSGLELGAITYGPGPSGWLAVALSAATAPATVTLQPTTILAPGTYTASISVTSGAATNGAQIIAVTLATYPSVALADLICGLLGTCALSPGQLDYADAVGNGSGGLDLGDLLAWIDRFGGHVETTEMTAIRARSGR